MSFADFNFSGEWNDIFSWLAGAEVREERVQRIPDELLKMGGHASWSLQEPVDLSRKVKAVFAELSTASRHNFRLWTSLRHDRYDDVGPSTRPKVGINWNPNENWMVSATWGEAFKAPELMQLYACQIVFKPFLRIRFFRISDPTNTPQKVEAIRILNPIASSIFGSPDPSGTIR